MGAESPIPVGRGPQSAPCRPWGGERPERQLLKGAAHLGTYCYWSVLGGGGVLLPSPQNLQLSSTRPATKMMRSSGRLRGTSQACRPAPRKKAVSPGGSSSSGGWGANRLWFRHRSFLLVPTERLKLGRGGTGHHCHRCLGTRLAGRNPSHRNTAWGTERTLLRCRGWVLRGRRSRQLATRPQGWGAGGGLGGAGSTADLRGERKGAGLRCLWVGGKWPEGGRPSLCGFSPALDPASRLLESSPWPEPGKSRPGPKSRPQPSPGSSEAP